MQNINLKNDDAVIEPIKFSPDGKKIYTTSSTNIIQYDIKSNTKKIRELDTYPSALSFSPKTGDLVLTGDYGSGIQIYDLNTLKPERNITPNLASSINVLSKSNLISCPVHKEDHIEYFLFNDSFNFADRKITENKSNEISDSGYFEIDKKNNLIKYRSPDNKYSEFPLQKMESEYTYISGNPNSSLFCIWENTKDKRRRIHIYDLNDYYGYIEDVLPNRNLDKNRKANKVYNNKRKTPYGKNKKKVQLGREAENGYGSNSGWESGQ